MNDMKKSLDEIREAMRELTASDINYAVDSKSFWDAVRKIQKEEEIAFAEEDKKLRMTQEVLHRHFDL